MSNNNNSRQILQSMQAFATSLIDCAFFASRFAAIIIILLFFSFLFFSLLFVFYCLLSRLVVLGLDAAHDLSSLGHHVSEEDISA